MIFAPLRLPRVAALAVVSLLAVLVALPSASADDSGKGELTVTTSPQVDAEIRVDGEPRNRGELAGLTLPVGQYTVCFSTVDGYLPPPCETVEIGDEQTTHIRGEFEPAGWLEVTTEPESLDAAVSIDGEVRDRGAVRLPVAAGTHEVCFGPATGHQAPACQVVEVEAGAATTVTGAYEPVTDDEAPSDDESPDPEVDDPIDEPLVESVHVALLHGAASRAQGNQWTATATAIVQDHEGRAVEGVRVDGHWETSQDAGSLTSSCVTDRSGTCSLEAAGMAPGRGNTATYTLDALELEGHEHDADGGPQGVVVHRNGDAEAF